MLFYLCFIFFCLLLVICLYDWFSSGARLLRQIPGPKVWPVIGNSLNFLLPSDKLFLYMRSLHKDYGHLSQISAMNMRVVNLSNPEDMEILLSSPEHITKEHPYNFMAPWLGEGLLLSNGQKWNQRRKLLSKAFHYNILKKFMITFTEATEELLKRIEQETGNDQTDVASIVHPLALCVICETAMGISLRDNKIGFSKYFKEIVAMGVYVYLRTSNIWLKSDLIFNLTPIGRKQKDTLQYLHGFTKKVINDRRELLKETSSEKFESNRVTYEKNNKMALLDLLLESEKSGVIDNEGIREEVDNFMLAGHDTIATGLTYFLMIIANEPAIQDKIYEETRQVLGDTQRWPTMEELNELKYLECCIKESMRLYTTTPIIARKLLKDTVLSGYTVPAGTTCFLYLYDLHHRADVYPDPERFDPDRFLPENCQKRNPYAYIPFSAGVRNCIGQKFAMLELKMVVSSLLRKFRVEPVTRPSELIFKADIVLRTKNPIYVRFRLRN